MSSHTVNIDYASIDRVSCHTVNGLPARYRQSKHVRVQHLLPIVRISIYDIGWPGNASIVHQDVNRPDVFLSPFEGIEDFLFFGHVDLHSVELSMCREILQLVCQLEDSLMSSCKSHYLQGKFKNDGVNKLIIYISKLSCYSSSPNTVEENIKIN